MHPLRYLWQPIYTLYVAVTFIVGILLMAPVVALLAIPNSIASRRLIYHFLNAIAWVWLYLIFMPPKKMGTLPQKDKRYVVVANHIAYIDAVLLFPASPGYFRPLGKKEMGSVPVFGFIYKQIVLLVDRSSAYSRAKSMRLMYRTLRHQCNVFIFPEGTFNETSQPMKDLYDGAFRLAINAQMPLLPVLFLDTVKRNDYRHWWKFSPGWNRLYYLPPIPTEGLTSDDLPALKDKLFETMSEALGSYGYPYWEQLSGGKA